MISYKQTDVNTVVVYLDGKHTGEIIHFVDGYQYWPKGSRSEGGQVFPTLDACQKSLES